MSKKHKAGIVVVSLLVLALGMYLLYHVLVPFGVSLFMVLSSEPAVEFVQQVPSPDGKYMAYLYSMEFPLDERKLYNVTVCPTWRQPPSYFGFACGRGNIYCGELYADMAWSEEGVLQLSLRQTYHNAIRIHHQRSFFLFGCVEYT